jgi:hypothetical protein
MAIHANYHFSVTVYTPDLAVVECLRALAKFSQETGNNQIPWGGTKDTDWRNAGHKITLHFSSAAYRERLKSEPARLLPSGLFKIVSDSDADPARPQSF